MACIATSLLAQAQQYPPPPPDQPNAPAQQQQPYPQPQGQYPQPGQDPQQGQYPQQQQGQYPPPQAQYPPPQGQYPQQQGGYSQPPLLPPQQLDQMVQAIALYPDGLLAQVLTASTFYNQIPEAAGWANQHSYLQGPTLAQAIQQDNLPWDPSILALLPFPTVLNQLANNMGWTQQLGNAVLAQRNDVMDAVQRDRQEAYNYGYLRTNPNIRVVYSPGAVQIVPVSPEVYYVPYYNPYIVFARPRPGFFVGGAIRFGVGISIGAAFAPWGWGGVGFGWREHTILIDHHPWERTWVNRGAYVHPYAYPHAYDHAHYAPGPAPHYEHHEYHELRGPAHYDGHEHDHGGRDHR